MSEVLCERVIDVAANYLGPTARRFVYRQIFVHLGKKPDDIEGTDILILADWSKIAFAIITNNKKEVDRFYEALLNLAQEYSSKKKHVTTTAKPSVH